MPSAKKKKGDERDESPVRGEEKRYWVAISEDVRSNDKLKIFTKKRFAKEYISDILERDDEETQWKSVKVKNKTTYSCNNGTWILWNKRVTS